MIPSGIISQYGFLYQREAFVLCVLENMSVDKTYKFEGKDDIEINADEKIYEIDIESNACIQVKSGTVDKACFKKIVGNWLLMDDLEKDSFVLFLEYDLKFEWSLENMTKEIISFVKCGCDKKKSSVARKVFDIYKDDIENNESLKLKNDLGIILKKVQKNIYSIHDLETCLKTKFFDDYCQDIIEYDIAKGKRLETFLEYVYHKIDDSIKEKKTFCFTYQDFIRIIMEVRDNINDHSYKVDVVSLKKRFKPYAEKIVEKKENREVKQLFIVDSQNEFVVEGIVDELFYKDFRENFVDQKFLEISNTEVFARENYYDAKNEIGIDIVPRNLYFKTVSKNIESELLPAGPMYRKGCYIYLTGDEVEEDKQITWGDADEIK